MTLVKWLCYKCLHYGLPVQYRKTTSKCCAKCGKCVFFSNTQQPGQLKRHDEWLSEQLAKVREEGQQFHREYFNDWTGQSKS